jgi:HK97 family phage prohead protease
MNTRFKQYTPQLEVGEGRKMAFTISTAAVDRDGDTINPKGWQLDNYRKNPVVLWAHDYSQLPVAKATNITSTEHGLKAEVEFPPEGTYPFADQVHAMLKAGFLNSTSVGFAPIDMTPATDRQKGYDFAKQELLEFSIVPVPANPEALVEQRGCSHDQVTQWTKAVMAWASQQEPVGLKAIRKALGSVPDDEKAVKAFCDDYAVESDEGKRELPTERIAKLLAIHDLKQPSTMPYETARMMHDDMLNAHAMAGKAAECCEDCGVEKGMDEAHAGKVKEAHSYAKSAQGYAANAARRAHEHMLAADRKEAPRLQEKAESHEISEDVLSLTDESAIDWDQLDASDTNMELDAQAFSELILASVKQTLTEMAGAQAQAAINQLTGRLD